MQELFKLVYTYGSKGILYVSKGKAIISCKVSTQLVCILVFIYAKSRFSHEAAHICL